MERLKFLTKYDKLHKTRTTFKLQKEKKIVKFWSDFIHSLDEPYVGMERSCHESFMKLGVLIVSTKLTGNPFLFLRGQYSFNSLTLHVPQS